MKGVLAAPLLLLLLAGCTPTVSLTPAPGATAVGCASVVVGLPAEIGGAAKRVTDAQGTAAWGTPASVTLTCGVETPAVFAGDCFPVDGVDWLVEDRRVGGEPAAVFTTFGRDPGVQVVVTEGEATRSDVLQAVSEPVGDGTRATGRRCIAVTDVPSPTP